MDAHKATHTCVAIDDLGRILGDKTFPATTDGHLAALHWARKTFGAKLTWAVEDVRTVTRRLEYDLFSAGQRVVRVPSKLTARIRASARTYGKSDTIDAAAIARAALREPNLPVAEHDPVTRNFRLLTDRREALIQQRTAVANRALMRLHELDPQRVATAVSLNYAAHRDPLVEWLDAQPGLVAEFAHAEVVEIGGLTEQIKDLKKRITNGVRCYAPHLLDLDGCGFLVAAKIVGETGNVTRFTSEAAFARYIGVAPLEYSSGSTAGRVRVARTGNRSLNAALHRIALIQIRQGGPGRAYYEERKRRGDNPMGALRHLKRRLVRVVFNRLLADHKIRAQHIAAAP
ncbi:IS110 family transposase [Mycolicibacterium sp. BiH015]|nr:IS110 family transposase [Mycolicibacterium sp. BiH015]MDA2893340.1 IS110 family transposase [Mycolicibacterium sp. BiH015]